MSMPLVSIIIPTYNSSATLGECLESVKKQSYNTPQESRDSQGVSIEIIVVDNNSTDNTKEIAKKYTDKVFNKGPERSAQRNYGVTQSQGEYVLIVDSDMNLSKHVVSACIEKMHDYDNIKAIIVPEESFGKGFWAQCKKLERSFYVGVDWMEAARFFRRTEFDIIGGYDENNTGTEDYDLPHRFQKKWGNNVISRADQYIFHNEQMINLRKTCGKKFYYAQRLDEYKANDANITDFRKQANPLMRYKLFLSQPKKLFKNPIIGIGMLFMKTTEFAFGGVGLLVGKVKK